MHEEESDLSLTEEDLYVEVFPRFSITSIGKERRYRQLRDGDTTERLGSYLASRPKKAAQIVLALSIAVVIIAGMLIVALDLGRFFKPPYPSETTPLNLVDNGVGWTRDFTMVVQGADGEWGMNYSEYRFCWAFEYSHGFERWVGPVASDADESELSSHVNATTRTYLGTRTPWFDAPNLSLYLSIHDTTGDGVFSKGDYMIIEGAPRTEGIVYTIGLAWVGRGTMSEEFSYAFHDGKFYSWASNKLPTEGPWWG